MIRKAGERAMPGQERVTRLTAREPDSAKIARIEEAVNGIREDVSDIKASLGNFDHRLTYVEDVRVRALEDRETWREATDHERARSADAAQEAAERAAAEAASHATSRITERSLRWSVAAVIFAAVVGPLIGHFL